MQHSCATVVHQKQKENMPSMKKVYSPFADFYIPEKRCCFWVRVVMQTVGGKLRKQQTMKPYTYVVLLAKSAENTLQQ